MAVDYEKLRKKAKKRDEEKQKKDAYEYSRSMYEGAKKNRSNVSANTYKLYYDDYIKNTKAYKNEQKKGINDERKSQLKAVLNMINPADGISASEARKNYKSAQKEKEKKQSAYDKLKEEYETLNGSKQKKNLLMSEIGKVGETLYGNPYDAERKNEVKQIYNKSKQEAYEQQAYDADIKQKAREETAAKNKNALSKDKEISKKAEQAYRYKNAIAEKSKASGADDMSSALLSAMGVGSKGQNDVDYSKKYNDSLKELQSLINKKGYKDIKAEDLIDYYIANKNSEQQAKVIKGAEKAAQEHPVIMQAARTLTSPLRAQANIANTIDMAVNGKSSINGTADFITNAAYGTKKGLEDKVANDGLINLAGKKIGPISVNKNNEIEILGNNMGNVNAALYDNIDQMAENVYNSLLFGGGITGGITASGKAEKAKQALINGVFSTAAMGDDISSQLASGSSSGETIKSSVKGAIINFLTEMVGAPLEWADVKGNSTFGKILVSGLNEGTEEIIGNVVDRTYDQITQGQLSELSQLKRSYLEQGLSEQEADKEVVKSMLAEDIFAALQAGFAGAVMSGSEIAPNNIIESAQNNIDNKKLGAEAKALSNSDIQAIIDEGLSKNKNSKAYKYAEELQAKVKTSQANGDVLTGASIYDEADYSKINEKRLGQLQTEIVKEGFKENIATAIEGEKNEDRINKAISKMVNGFELSRYDVKVIKDSEKAINAINEEFGSDFTEKDISNDSLEALSTKLKNGYTDYSFTYDGYSKYQQRAENTQNAVLEENTPNVSEYTQKPVETLTAEQQSNNLKYNVNAVAITADGNQAAVKIYGKHPFEVSADRSNFKVKTSAGDIDYNNISFENQTQQVLTNEIINKNFGNSGANAVYVNFDPNNLKGASVSTYVSQAKMLYDLGVAKPDVPFDKFVIKNPAFYPAVKFLGDKAINIYRSGQTDVKSYDAYIEEQRKNKKSPTKTTRHIEGEYKNISDSDSTIDDVFISVARKTRVDIERHSDGRQGGNGQFIPSLAKIIINADGSGEYNALIHELGEFGLAYNEQEYQNVQSAIRDWYVSYKGADNFNALVDAYIDTYTKAEGSKTRAEAIDELTNDAVSGLFSTDDGVEQFAEWLSDNKTEAEKKSIIETIADFLKSVIEKIKSVIATSNLQTAARNAMEMEQKRADHIRKQFLNMLDNASNNLYNGTEVEENTKNSVTLGKFADVDINSNEKLEKFGIINTARTLNDFVYIQKKVLTALNNENFFNQNNKNIVVNADTDIVVSITKNGIRETLSTEKRYVKLPRKIKIAKIAVIDNLPDMIRYAEVVNENEKNYHSKEGSPFLVLSHPAIVDGENYNVEIKIKKTPVENKFYIHNMNLQNKNETVALNAKDKISRAHNNNELSRTDNIANNASNVNNNETKFSLDVDRFLNDLRNAQLYQYNGYEHFSKAKELYQRYQSGIANKNNFYVNTLADFKEISKRPKGKPDYVSYYFDKTGKRKISSEYWYNENGVVRGSDHWGEGISSCDWYLDGKARKGYKHYGEARWEEFTLQTKTVQYDGKEFLTAFDNSYGKNSLGKPIYKIGDDYINYDKYLKKYTKVENVDIPGTDTKFSLDTAEKAKSIDEKYKNANESEKSEIIEQLAKKWGAFCDENGRPIKFYHGTKKFGFTEFDLDKMDDKKSIFLTSDILTASTYSSSEVERNISEYEKNVDYSSMSLLQLAKEINDNDISAEREEVRYKYYDFDKISEIENAAEKNIAILREILKKEISDSEHSAKSENVKKLIKKTISATPDTYKNLANSLFMALRGNNKYLNLTKNRKYKEIYDSLYLSGLFNDTEGLDEGVIVKKTRGWYYDLLKKEDAVSFLEEFSKNNMGNYSLYAKIENPFIVDVENHNWNDITYYEDLPEALKDFYPHGLWRRGTTRSVVQYAYNRGYDGVVFKNIIDNGGQNYDYLKFKELHPADYIVAVFNPKNVKSADVTTFNNDGSVILPTKRFSENEDIRFSLDVDSDGNKLTQQQAEYFKNSKIRDEDGNLLKVYHGTSESFTVFDKTKGRANMDIQGMFFSPWELDAKGYGENVNAYYINIINPASEQMGYKALRKFQGQNNAGVKAREYLESLGYDGVNNGDEEYIAFNSNQIKLADNLTPTENEDVRLSRDVDYAEYAELKRENKHLKEINEVLKHQFELTNGREVSTNSLLIAARKIIKLTPTRMTGVDVAKEMKSWHTLDTSQQFFNAAYDLAQKLVENEKQIKYQPTQEEQEMLDYLKNTEIKLSDKQKEEVAYYFGTYGKYKNAARGKINITENGILLDDLANEMEELFGGLMPSDNSQDMPIALLDMVNTYKDKVIENDYGYSKEEYLESLANDILSYYFKTNLYETKADKNEKRFLKARSKYAQQISNYQKLLADEKAKHKKEFSAFREEQVHKNQQYRSDLYRDTIQYKAEFRKNFKEEKLKVEYRKRIKRNLLRLASLAKQTKTKHIPNNMVESVRDLCYTVTTDTKFDDKILDKVKNLNDSFTRLSADKTDTYHYITNLYNEWLMKDLAALENSIGNKTVAMLNSTELSKLDDIISMTLTTIGKANKLFGYERNKTIEKSVYKVKEEIESISVKQINNRYLRSLGYNSMKPEYFFEYLGSDELLKLYRDVRKGEDTWAVTISDSKNFADDIREKYNWKSWNFDKITEYKSLLGEKLKFDLQDLMSLYAFSRREQAKNHILHGGIKFADTKNKKKSNKYSTHKLSKQDLKYLTDLLTEEQKEYVRDMVKYLSTDMAEKGNEVTRQLYDVELFKEENYFPMKVDGDSVKEKSTEVKGTKKIKNSGMTNATVEGAKQALILNGFDSVWAGHVDEMAKYHAFTLPLENFDKVYNYSDIDVSNKLTSIKEKIKNKYGNEAISYISKLIENINGGVVREPGTDITDKFVSMFKKNAVFASASVAIQQPSAIGRALSIIDPKYFLTTHGSYKKGAYEEIKKYAPVAIIKEMGYFDTNMAQSTVDYLNNIDYKGLEKVPAFFKDGAFRDEVFGYTASKADEITWSHIWNACKAETKDKYPDLSTEERLKKAGERFTDVITKTQVYDSVFSRSALMRSKDRLTKVATAFMAEPTTSLNMLFNAAVQAKRGKFSKKKATRIVASLVIASVINALLQSVVTAARNDDDDKTYLEAYLAELIPNFIDNANPVNQIAFVKDVANIFKGYDVTRADMDSVGDLVSAVKNLWSDNLTPWKKVQNIAGALGTFIGWPIENVMRDVRSVYNMVHKGLTIGLGVNKSALKSATMDGIKESLVTDDVLAVFGLDLFPEKDKQQMIYEAIKDGNKDMYKRIADNVSNPDNYIKKGLIENDERVAAAGLAYLDGNIGTAINTAKELESDGFDYEIAYKAIKSYSSEIQKAAGYKADSDDKKYKQSLETLISSGTDKETVEKAIDTVKIDEEQDSKDSKLYNKTDLINALNSGDESILKTVIDGNIATDISNGKTKAEAEKSIKSSLKSAFKEEYLAADNSKRSQIKTKLKSTGYFDDEDFTNWEASSYNTEAMVEAFKSNDTKSIRDYVDNRIKAKVANGMTQDNAVFGIRTSIANQYKAKFINGNADEKAKIITIMTKTGLYGNRTDVINYINKYWLK